LDRKKRNIQHTKKRSLEEKRAVDCKSAAQMVAKRTEAGSELVL